MGHPSALLRDSVIDTIHQHRMLKFRMTDSLARLWKDQRDEFEIEEIRRFSRSPQQIDILFSHEPFGVFAQRFAAELPDDSTLEIGIIAGRRQIAARLLKER